MAVVGVAEGHMLDDLLEADAVGQRLGQARHRPQPLFPRQARAAKVGLQEQHPAGGGARRRQGQPLRHRGLPSRTRRLALRRGGSFRFCGRDFGFGFF